MTLLHKLRLAARKCGYDICRITPANDPILRRKKLFDSFGIKTVFDVGANDGVFGRELRASGYTGRIISFEPLSSTYAELNRRVKNDPNWEAWNIGLGEVQQSAQINISGNTTSSSLLAMLPAHETAAPESVYVGQEEIAMKRLEVLFDELHAEENICLKIDTQGYEGPVLRGSEKILDKIKLLQVELSLVPLYAGQMLYKGILDYIGQFGFELLSIEPGFMDQDTGRLLQMDGLFVRE